MYKLLFKIFLLFFLTYTNSIVGQTITTADESIIEMTPAELQLLVEELMQAKQKRRAILDKNEVSGSTNGALSTLLDQQQRKEEVAAMHHLLIQINQRLKNLEEKQAVSVTETRLPVINTPNQALKDLKEQLQKELLAIRTSIQTIIPAGATTIPSGASEATVKEYWLQQAQQNLQLKTLIGQLEKQMQELVDKEDYLALQQQLDRIETKLQQSFAAHEASDLQTKNQFQSIRLTLEALKKEQLQLQQYLPPPDTVYAHLQRTIQGKEKQQIFFANNSYELAENDLQLIQQTANLVRVSDRLRVVIIGYTDTKGSATYNKELSLERAEVVKKHLVQQGVAPSWIFTQNNGKDYSSKDSAAARRVELLIVIQ